MQFPLMFNGNEIEDLKLKPTHIQMVESMKDLSELIYLMAGKQMAGIGDIKKMTEIEFYTNLEIIQNNGK